MKMYRVVSLLLALMLLFSFSALAEGTLIWDFTAGSGSDSSDEDIPFSDSSDEDLSFGEVYVCADFVIVSGGDCHVRSMPDLSGASLGVLRNGQRAECLGGQSTDYRGVVWYEIDFNGMSGWVSSKYARLNGVGVVRNVKVVGGDSNLRANPNLNGSLITTLRAGSVASYLGGVSVDDRGVDWYYVSYNGYDGWISSKYAQLVINAASSSPSSGYVKATSYKVNLRSIPSLSGEDIGTMDKGETATYLGKKSTDYRGVVWYKVRFNGEEGWVSSKYSKLYN